MKLPEEQNLKIAIIGVGYVGLPLAINFANYFSERNKLNIDCNYPKNISLKIPHKKVISSQT